MPCRTQRLREAAASRSFHLKNTGVLRDLAFEPYTFVASAAVTAPGAGTSRGEAEGGGGGGGSGEEGWDDWGDDENAHGVSEEQGEREGFTSASQTEAQASLAAGLLPCTRGAVFWRFVVAASRSCFDNLRAVNQATIVMPSIPAGVSECLFLLGNTQGDRRC